MTTKNMTLAEALASGRPFKQDCWDKYITDTHQDFIVNKTHALDATWQILPEEQPPMRVYECVNDARLYIGKVAENSSDTDFTVELAAALAPHLKELLK